MNTLKVFMTESLREAISLLSRVALSNKKSDDAYVEAIKIDKRGVMYAVNPVITISYKLSVGELGLTPQFPESDILIPAKGINILQNVSDNSEVTISESDNQLTIKTGKGKGGKSTFASMKANAFPKIDGINTEKQNSFYCGDLVEAVKVTSQAISANSAKPLYNGLHFISDTENLTIFACDGYSAAIYQIPYESDEFTVSIPRECINLLNTAISKKESTASVALRRTEMGRSAAFIVDEQTIIITRLLEGELINYKDFFDCDLPHKVGAKKDALLSILKSINIVAEKGTLVSPTVLHFVSDGVCEFSYKNATSEYYDVLQLYCPKNTETAEMTIGMNNDFLTNAVKSMPGNNIIIFYEQPLKQIKISAIIDSGKNENVSEKEAEKSDENADKKETGNSEIKRKKRIEYICIPMRLNA